MAMTELDQDAENGSPAALDFGCGIGMMIPALASLVEVLYVCDEQLAPARATARFFDAANVVCLLPEEIESRIGISSLDVVIAADVFEHVEDLTTLVETVRCRLRPGGALIVSGPTENWAYRCGRRIVGFSGEYHVRSVFDVESGIQAGGFTREQLRTLPLPSVLPLFRITLWRRGD
jgi:2-polyprenyl-3-methyl-5-hydroxy-6-metoxy-1,4-benzoquinol methylase